MLVAPTGAVTNMAIAAAAAAHVLRFMTSPNLLATHAENWVRLIDIR